MTTYDDVLREMENARQAAAEVFEAVQQKTLWLKISPIKWHLEGAHAEGMVQNASMNLATIEMLPEVLDDALAEQDQGTALAQAMVIVQLTGESTVRYAEWVESSVLVTFVQNVWTSLVQLIADLAYEVANAVLVIGKRVGEGVVDAVGGGALVVAGVLGLGLVGFFIATR